jgi:hypothetical protein
VFRTYIEVVRSAVLDSDCSPRIPTTTATRTAMDTAPVIFVATPRLPHQARATALPGDRGICDVRGSAMEFRPWKCG